VKIQFHAYDMCAQLRFASWQEFLACELASHRLASGGRVRISSVRHNGRRIIYVEIDSPGMTQ